MRQNMPRVEFSTGGDDAVECSPVDSQQLLAQQQQEPNAWKLEELVWQVGVAALEAVLCRCLAPLAPKPLDVEVVRRQRGHVQELIEALPSCLCAGCI